MKFINLSSGQVTELNELTPLHFIQYVSVLTVTCQLYNSSAYWFYMVLYGFQSRILLPWWFSWVVASPWPYTTLSVFIFIWACPRIGVYDGGDTVRNGDKGTTGWGGASGLRTLEANMSISSGAVEILSNLFWKSWNIMHHFFYGCSLDFPLNTFEERTCGWHLGCICISSSVIRSQNWTKGERPGDLLSFTGKNHGLPLAFPLVPIRSFKMFPTGHWPSVPFCRGGGPTGGPLSVFKQLLGSAKNGFHCRTKKELKLSAARKATTQQLKLMFSRTLFIASQFYQAWWDMACGVSPCFTQV